ncbi:hypothetical protein [Kamptonema formosum]|uniref:hypothetical protein n=1 Tax=Kamptonema formosum TaxID=331992 RepID=UPI00034A2FA2|nr:hypothetical protein [Oscillatoria sp. PCC 10802]
MSTLEPQENFRLQRVNTRKAFADDLVQKGANGYGIAMSTNAMYQELYSKNADGLYAEYGAVKGNRDTLPREVQEDIMVAEIVARRHVNKHSVAAQQQRKINLELRDVVKKATKQAKDILY